MYLIFLSAKENDHDNKQADLPEHDLQPITLALNSDEREYFLRDTSTKHIKDPKPEGYEDVERVFVNMRGVEDPEEFEHPPSEEDLETTIESGKAQLAVALATVLFATGKLKPDNLAFARYVRERARLADRLIVVDYTDVKCSMGDSERIALERARAVRDILLVDSITTPMIVIARPLCAFGRNEKVSRRVEITALFNGNIDDDDQRRRCKPADDDDEPRGSRPTTGKRKTQARAARKTKKQATSTKRVAEAVGV